MQNNIPKVLIIGAGPSGLSILRAFKLLEKDQALAELSCYDVQEDWMGQWNLNWKIGVDQYGYPIQNSMYKGLWSNIAKQVNEYPDYHFLEHFKVNVSSYMPRPVWRDYLQGRFSKVSIKDQIQFQTAVRDVTFNDQTHKFHAKMHNLRQDSYIQKEFDYVAVASGHYSVPNYPYYKGFENFPGKIFHSRDLRGWDEFKGQRVLLIGSGPSSSDMACQLHKFGAKSITISYRTKALVCKFPENIEQLPLLLEVKDRTVIFTDNSKRQYDTIILCTGYIYSFPFMQQSLKLRTKLLIHPPLYNTVVFPDNPCLFYMAMQKQTYSFTTYDLQAYYVRDVILGRVKLPSTQQMKENINLWLGEEEACKPKGMEDRLGFMQKLITSMAKLSEDYPQLNLEISNKSMRKTVRDRVFGDIATYRNEVFTSAFTGTVSKEHPVPWMDDMEDTLEGYMQYYRDKK